MKKNDYIQSGLQLERNKFRLNKKKEDYALNIFRARKIELYEDFIGMSLERGENKALLAIQKILNARTPSINHKTKSTEFPSRLKFSLPEYYDAYGVGKTKTKRGWMEYNVRESKLALNALRNLGIKPHQFFYKRVRWVGDKKDEDRRTSFKAFVGTLINFTAGFTDLKDNEVEELISGKWSKAKMEERADMDIGLSIIITDQMEEYYVLMPSNLYNDIKQITDSTSKYIPAFIQWCIVEAELKRRDKDFDTKKKIHRDKLARTLRMDYWIRTHRIEKINKTLQLCYEVAHKLEYLSNALSHEEIHVLTLNPEKYPYWNEEREATQKLWHQKEYKRKKLIEKRLKY